jgi:hypothetical protein
VTLSGVCHMDDLCGDGKIVGFAFIRDIDIDIDLITTHNTSP